MKTLLTTLSTFLLLFTFVAAASAQDNPCTAKVLNLNALTCPHQQSIDALSTATASTVPAPTGCTSTVDPTGKHDLWYETTVPAAQTQINYTILWKNSASKGSYALYEKVNNDCNNLQIVTCGKAKSTNNLLNQNFTVTAGKTYLMRIWDETPTNPDVSVIAALPPTNDHCANALPLSGSGCNYGATGSREDPTESSTWSPEANGTPNFCQPTPHSNPWNTNDNGVWYTFHVYPNTVQPISLTVDNIVCSTITGSTGGQIQVGVWAKPTANPCNITPGSCLGCAVGAGTVNLSISSTLPEGDYYVYIDGQAASPCGFTLRSPQLICAVNVTGAQQCNIQAPLTANLVGSPNVLPSAYTYSWQGPSGFTANTQTVTPNAVGVYSVTVSDGQGCSNTSTISLVGGQSGAIVTLTGGNTALNCTTTTATLTANISNGTGATVQWKKDGVVISGATSNTLNVTAGGNYTVVVSSPNGCVASSTQAVAQNTTVPVVAITASTTQLTCQVSAATLTAAITNGGSGVFSWFSNGTQVGSGSTFNATQAGTYVVSVTGSNGCSASPTSIIISATGLTASITTTATVLPCTPPQQLVLQAVVGSVAGPLTYSWTFNGATIPNANTATVTATQAGQYVVTVHDTACMRTAFIFIDPPQIPTLSLSPNNPTLTCAAGGSTIVLNANTNIATATFQWAGAGIIAGQGTHAITVNQGGTYAVTVTGAPGCTTSSSVTVNAPNTPSVGVSGIPNTIGCGTNNALLTASVSPGPANAYTYAWSGAGIVSGQATRKVTINIPDTYIVTVTAQNGCTTTAAFTVNAFGIALAPAAAITCNRTRDTLRVQTNLASPAFMWSAGNGGNIVAGVTTAAPVVNKAGTYTVTVTGASGCSFTATVVVTENKTTPTITIATPDTLRCNRPVVTLHASSSTGNISYIWLPKANVVSGDSTANAQVATGGTYTAYVTNLANGCHTTVTTNVVSTVIVPTSAVAAAAPGALFCKDSLILNVATNANTPSYAWAGGVITSGSHTASVGVKQEGTYRVTITDVNGCTKIDSIAITRATSVPTVDILPTAANIPCGVDTIALTLSTSALVPNIGWTGPNGFTSSAFSPTATKAGVYSVTVTDTDGNCSNSASITVTKQGINLTKISGDTVICGNTPVTLSTNDIESAVYQWRPTNSTTHTTTATAAGWYVVSVTDLSGCTGIDSVKIRQQNLPTVSAGNPISVKSGDTFQLNGSTNAKTYTWTPANYLDNPNILAPQGSIAQTTTFMFVGTDSLGCKASGTVTVSILGLNCLKLAEGFTPNNDGVNDTWLLPCLQEFPNTIQVINRWGQILFTTNYHSPSDAWDGTSQGKPVPDGTYYYVILVPNLDPAEFKGTITVLRSL